MIYELRIYHCVTGRLPALLKRFETTTLELWKRHGIRQAGFWTVLVGDGGNQDLHYLLAWESLAERETKWNAFATDPEWLAKRAESERDGPDRRLDQEHVPAADGVLGGEVTPDRCPAASTISSMRCAISTRRPSSIAGSASPSGRATGIPGARTITWSSCRDSSSSC